MAIVLSANNMTTHSSSNLGRWQEGGQAHKLQDIGQTFKTVLWEISMNIGVNGEIGQFMKQKSPESTLLADNTQGFKQS